MKAAIICFLAVLSLSEARQIRFINRCPHTICVSPLTNGNGPMIPGGIVRLGANANLANQISNNAFAYGDEVGLHICPKDTSFDVTFCHI